MRGDTLLSHRRQLAQIFSQSSAGKNLQSSGTENDEGRFVARLGSSEGVAALANTPLRSGCANLAGHRPRVTSSDREVQKLGKITVEAYG